MSNNPFDWQNYKPTISLKDIARAQKSSYQQTAVVNKRRAAGVEPNPMNLPGSRVDLPQRYATEMPIMPKYDKNEARKRKRQEAKK